MSFVLSVIISFGSIFLSFIKRRCLLILSIVCVCYLLFIVTRSISVPDTDSYIDFYQRLEAGNINNLLYFSFEPGFQFFGHFAKLVFGGNYIVFFSLISLINVLLVIFSIKRISCVVKTNKRIDYVLSVVLYFAYFGFFYNAIVLRAGVAMSILLYSTTIIAKKNIKRKDYFLIIGLCLLALSFHLSSIIGIIAILFFSCSKRLSVESYLVIWLLISFLFFSGSSIFLVKELSHFILLFFSCFSDSDYKKYEYYLYELDRVSFYVSYKYIFQLLSGLMLLLVKNDTPSIYYKYLNVYFVGLFLGAIFCSIEQMSRLTDFFIFYLFVLQWLYFSYSYSRIKRIKWALYPSVLIQLIFVFRIINQT